VNSDHASALGLSSLGMKQVVNGVSPDRLDKEIEYATKSGSHLWNSLVVYLHTEDNVRKAYAGTEHLIMDGENLLTHAVGCFICEEPYTKEIASKRCKGQPKGTLQYMEER
jgi:hypothetical protein